MYMCAHTHNPKDQLNKLFFLICLTCWWGCFRGVWGYVGSDLGGKSSESYNEKNVKI